MSERRLDRPTIDVVKRAWKSILERHQDDPTSGVKHFFDNEADVGLLKDVDALNALIEPFLLAPRAFDDPPLPIDDLFEHAVSILKQRESSADDTQESSKGRGDKTTAPLFRGFVATPYPYVQVPVDFVDSAAAFLRLIWNLLTLSEARRKGIPDVLQKLMADATSHAADFLIEAAVEDEAGVRWQGIARRTEPVGRYASLFFTNAAALTLLRATSHATMQKWLGSERRDRIGTLLRQVPLWVSGQYDPSARAFWMDADKTIRQPVGVVYALELIYSLVDPLPENYRSFCASALLASTEQMTTLSDAATLQRDFFHTLPFPSGAGVAFYDDRRYIGSFLSVLTLAKAKDAETVTDASVRAGEVLLLGVREEWVDESTGLWDDGRPLICFSYDALVGLVRYALEGTVGVLTLRENELRSAIKEALTSGEVVDTIFEILVQKARLQEDRALESQLMQASRRFGN